MESTNPATIMEVLSNCHNLRKLKDIYASSVHKKTKSREITKLGIFNDSILRISLPKFNGYELKFGYIYLSKRIFENPSKNCTKKNDG